MLDRRHRHHGHCRHRGLHGCRARGVVMDWLAVVWRHVRGGIEGGHSTGQGHAGRLGTGCGHGLEDVELHTSRRDESLTTAKASRSLSGRWVVSEQDVMFLSGHACGGTLRHRWSDRQSGMCASQVRSTASAMLSEEAAIGTPHLGLLAERCIDGCLHCRLLEHSALISILRSGLRDAQLVRTVNSGRTHTNITRQYRGSR